MDLLLHGCSFLTPLSFIELFLQKNIDMKCLLIHKNFSGLKKIIDLQNRIKQRGIYKSGKYLIDQMRYDPYYPCLEYVADIYETIAHNFELKLFEKICLQEDFSEEDVQFLRRQNIEFSIPAYEAGNSDEACVIILNDFKNNLVLE